MIHTESVEPFCAPPLISVAFHPLPDACSVTFVHVLPWLSVTDVTVMGVVFGDVMAKAHIIVAVPVSNVPPGDTANALDVTELVAEIA